MAEKALSRKGIIGKCRDFFFAKQKLGFVCIPVAKMSEPRVKTDADYERLGLRKVMLPDDPRLPNRSFRTTSPVEGVDMDGQVADQLEYAEQALNRAHLMFAEPGDPDAFLVKWKGKEGRP